MIDADNTIESIIRDSNSEDFILNNQIEYYFKRNIEFLEDKILKSSIPNLYIFIIINYKNVRLFHNRNHPTGILLKELCNEILLLLNINHKFEDHEEKYLEEILRDWVTPIFHCVSNYYNLEFETDICFSKYDDKINDINSYLGEYIKSIRKN